MFRNLIEATLKELWCERKQGIERQPEDLETKDIVLLLFLYIFNFWNNFRFIE